MRRLKSLATALALMVAPMAAGVLVATPAAAQQSDFDRGVAAYNAGRYEEAAEAYGKAAKSNPSDPYAWTYLGDSLAKLGRLDEAKPAYEKAIQINPQCVDCVSAMGSMFFNVKRDAEALPYYERAVRMDPSSARLNAYLGDTYLRLDRFKDANDSYSAALKIDPRHVDALRGMVLTYGIQNDMTNAKAWNEKLRAVDAAAAAKLDSIFVNQ